MRLVNWIESLFEPEKTNFRDAAMDDLLAALNEPAIRKHWMHSIMDELRAINVGVDRAMREEKYDAIPNAAARRTALVFCLNQILDSKTAVENELYDQARDNPLRAAQ